MIRDTIRRIFGFLPMTCWQFQRFTTSLTEVFEAIEVADAQHGQIEKGLVEKLNSLLTEGAAKKQEEEKELSEDKSFQ